MWGVDNDDDDDDDNDDDDDGKEEDDDDEDDDSNDGGGGGGNHYLLKSCHFFLFLASWVIVFQSFHAVFNSWRTDLLQFCLGAFASFCPGIGTKFKAVIELNKANQKPANTVREYTG